MRKNKYEYQKIVQGYYSGWEDLSASLSRKEANDDIKAYRLNAGGVPYRIISRRVLIED